MAAVGANRTGRLIRDRRLERKLTQAELGEIVGVGNQTVSRLESGRKSAKGATPGLLRALADALEIDPAAMLVAVASDLLGYSVTHEVAVAALELQGLPQEARRELVAAISAAADKARTAHQDAHASAQHRGRQEPRSGSQGAVGDISAADVTGNNSD